MHYRKSLRSKHVRFAMIPAALACVIVSGCADQETTAPVLPRVARTNSVSLSSYFTAWSQAYSSGPIKLQVFTLDARQDRQYGGWWPDEPVQAFARANPGRLYIHGDEPDQWCVAPLEYAEMYHAFVEGVRAVDPTARFSPAGFAEPNDRCCTPGDEVCRARKHNIAYAEDFYNAYRQRFGAPPTVHEWRFHDFGVTLPASDLDAWWLRVERAAAWSVAHGANMVLGAWGFHGWREPVSDFQEHMKQAMGRLLNDSRINGAVYWSYEQWVESPRPLVHSDGSLTPEGQTYANPLTDVPAGATTIGSPNGRAKLRWTNTTSAWSTEVEFWVKTPGAEAFTYHSTERIAAPAATESSNAVFRNGDAVKARARYYNLFGQAAWSSFSDAVVVTADEVAVAPPPPPPPPPPPAPPKAGTRKSPRFCFPAAGTQPPGCE